MAREHVIHKVTVAAATASATITAGHDFGAHTQMRCGIRVTAVTGTAPTLDVKLTHSVDDGNNYDDMAPVFAQRTAAGQSERIDITTTIFTGDILIDYTIGGTATPTFTFTVYFYAV